MDLHSLVVEKATSVISIEPISDSQPTIQDKTKIIELIRDAAPSFARVVLKSPNKSFSFGDKYFLPVYGNNLLCIPLKVENLRVWLSQNVQVKSRDEIEKDFNRMKPNMKQSGYFKVD